MYLAQLTRRLLLASVLVVVATLLLGACGGGDGDGDAAAPAPTDDAARDDDAGSDGSDSDDADAEVCGLLTDEEVTAATGEDIVEKRAETAQLDMCTWAFPVPEDSPQAGLRDEFSLNVVVMPQREYESRTGVGDIYEAVEGIGDEARFAFAGGTGDLRGSAQLYVLEGDQAVMVLAAPSFWDERDEALDTMGELAEAAHDRI